MAVAISSALIERLAIEAATSADEVCGLLLGSTHLIEEARACRNVAANPATRFEIDPAALIAAHREARGGGRAVIGSYHSHPNGAASPSSCDAAMANADGAIWLIVTRDTLQGWRAVDDGMLHGRFDPVILEVVQRTGE